MPPKPGPIDERLPLRWQTPPRWVDGVMRNPIAFLNDHAHLEKKAATNALELLLRWPGPVPPEDWIQSMTSIANDEVDHLQTVSRLLSQRGGRLTRNHQNRYAGDLRAVIRMGKGTLEIIDRLLVSALIEARSCERFELLSQHCPDAELARLYGRLYRSEGGHYRVFLALALDLPEAVRADVDARWDWMLDEEARIIQRQEPGPTMHSGVAG